MRPENRLSRWLWLRGHPSRAPGVLIGTFELEQLARQWSPRHMFKLIVPCRREFPRLELHGYSLTGDPERSRYPVPTYVFYDF